MTLFFKTKLTSCLLISNITWNENWHEINITSFNYHSRLTTQLVVYLPVVVSARPSGAPGVAGPCAFVGGTVEVVSALAMVTSLALLASSPQWGQKLWPFSTEAQARWKRWEMLRSGWHSINVPCKMKKKFSVGKLLQLCFHNYIYIMNYLYLHQKDMQE